jgi:hypothetical protein
MIFELSLQCEYIGRWGERCFCHEHIIANWAAQQVIWLDFLLVLLLMVMKAVMVVVEVAVVGLIPLCYNHEFRCC